MSVRVRFKVQMHRGAGGDDRTVVFVPVDDKSIPQPRQVSRFTPSGRLELFISNPGILAELPLDSEVYVDITAVDAVGVDETPAAAPDAAPTEPPAVTTELRDGPTLEEFVKHGYSPHFYPPGGYAEKPSTGLDEFIQKLAELIGGNAESAVTAVKGFPGGRALDRLEQIERDGKNRTSVLRAIAERRAELTASKS